jgi:excisionase family DNA binding protein
MPKTYTTSEAAKKTAVSRQTLHTWIANGWVVAPKPMRMGQRLIRFWTQKDIDVLKQFKGSLHPGPKGARNKS